MKLVFDSVALNIAASRMIDRAPPNEADAQIAGIEAQVVSANTQNCHFSFFETPQLRDAWMRGYEQDINEPDRSLRDD